MAKESIWSQLPKVKDILLNHYHLDLNETQAEVVAHDILDELGQLSTEMNKEKLYYKCPECGNIAPRPKTNNRVDGKIRCDFCGLLIIPKPFEFEGATEEIEYWDNVDTAEFWGRLPDADDVEFVNKDKSQ